MIVPGTVGAPQFGNVALTPRNVFDWRAIDASLTPRSGQTPTFARASAGTLYDAYGRVVNAANGQPRFARMYGQTVLLMEPSRTNTCLQSQTIATAPWASVGSAAITVTNAAGLAPDGTNTACNMVPSNVSGTHGQAQSMTVTSGEFTAVSIFVKANGYPAVLFRYADTGSTNGFSMTFDATNGAVGVTSAFGTGVLTGSAFVALTNGWYRLLMWGKAGAITTGQIFCYVFDTIAHANAGTSYAGNATSGVLAWGAQVERLGTVNSAPPTMYIPTVAATVTRAAETLTLNPITAVCQPLWFYQKFVEIGNVAQQGFGCGSNPVGANAAWFLTTNSVPACYEFFHFRASGPATGSLVSSAVPTLGQVVEHLGLIQADGSTVLRQSINGGADVVGATAEAALGFFSTWDGPQMNLGNGTGLTAYAAIKHGLGNPFQTIAQARAA